MPENAGQMQVLGQFQKGQSGNPKGKAKGTKNRASLALRYKSEEADRDTAPQVNKTIRKLCYV